MLLFRVEKITYSIREIVQNKPRSAIRAGDPVTPIIPRFSLGEESRVEDHGSSLFCVVNANPLRETFQLARAFLERGGVKHFISAT
jgi:hypothetical protein